MKTDQANQAAAVVVFLQTVSVAVAQLKKRLQQRYEQAHPDFGKIIRFALDEEEARACKMTLFPHLVLPDLVEARVAQITLRPPGTKHPDVFATPPHNQPVYAFAANHVLSRTSAEN